jgi:hypothetical protein
MDETPPETKEGEATTCLDLAVYRRTATPTPVTRRMLSICSKTMLSLHHMIRDDSVSFGAMSKVLHNDIKMQDIRGSVSLMLGGSTESFVFRELRHDPPARAPGQRRRTPTGSARWKRLRYGSFCFPYPPPCLQSRRDGEEIWERFRKNDISNVSKAMSVIRWQAA